RSITRRVDLETMPLYVRAGAIIPIDLVRQYVDQPVQEPTTIQIYRGADGEFTLYDDDGSSQEYLQGAGHWTKFTWYDTQRKLQIEPAYKSSPPAREFNVLVMPERASKKTQFNGTAIEVGF